MIRIADAIILASTKLHTYRVRTVVTVLLSSILFAFLVMSVVVYEGASISITSFNSEGLNNRYLVFAQADLPFSGGILSSDEFVSLVKQKGEMLIVSKKAEAKRLGIEYNAKDEPSAVIKQSFPGQNVTEHVNMQSYAFTEALNEYIIKHPSPGLNELKQSALLYNPIGFYSSSNVGIDGGDMKMMLDEKENFVPTENENNNLDFFHNASLMVVDQKLTSPFELQNIYLKNNHIPLIVSYVTAEKILNLPQLPSNASPRQQYDRIQQLYKDISIGNTTVTACYRNNISLQQISLAINQAQEITKNKNNKDYQKPNLIYSLPEVDSCGQADILSDTRTITEKKVQSALDQFNSIFGQTVTPVQHKLTFQIIGLSPSDSDINNTTFGSLLSGILGSSLTSGANVIPANLLDQMPNASIVKSIFLSNTGNPLSAPRSNFYVEFSNADDARSFILEKSCTTSVDGICSTPSLPFQLIASGNNSIALQDMLHKIINIIKIAAIIIIGLASIIMTGMIGRIIADGRHETAVFRALGAKRSDIAIIYAIYTLVLTFLIAVISLVVGIGMAYAFNFYYSQNATFQAKLLFDAVNTNLVFDMFNINILILSMIVAIIFITGLFSMTIPILRNIRRNPIQDMREE